MNMPQKNEKIVPDMRLMISLALKMISSIGNLAYLDRSSILFFIIIYQIDLSAKSRDAVKKIVKYPSCEQIVCSVLKSAKRH